MSIPNAFAQKRRGKRGRHGHLHHGEGSFLAPDELLSPRRRAQRGLKALGRQPAEPEEHGQQPTDGELLSELGQADAGAAGEATVELRRPAVLRAHERELWQASVADY